MAEQGRSKRTPDVTKSAQKKKSSKDRCCQNIRQSALLKTFIIACALPLIIFFVITSSTSDHSSYSYPISNLQTSAQRLKVSTPGDFYKIRPDQQTVTFTHRITDQRNYSRLDQVIYIQPPIPSSAFLLFGKNGEKRMKPIKIFNQFTHVGWNKVHISFDEYQDIYGADTVEVAFKAATNTAVIGIRNLTLSTYSPLLRVQHLFESLTRNEPLENSSINFNKSQKIMGYGFTLVLWLSLLLGILVLAVRKFLFKEKFQFLIHAAVITLIYFVMIDTRNSIDLVQNVRATTKQYLDSEDFYAHLTIHEEKYPWFGDLVEWLQHDLPPDKSYHIEIMNKMDPYKVVHSRVEYYCRPAHRVNNINKADYAVLIGNPREISKTKWRKKQSFDYTEVYERIK